MLLLILLPVFLVMTNKWKCCTGIGGINPNSDRTKSIHISAIASLSTITTNYTLHDCPKEKKNHTPAPSTMPDNDLLDTKLQTLKRKQVFLAHDHL
jgi:hypothetical protein